MWQVTLIKLGGVYCIALVVFHLLFWKLFEWKRDLKRLSPLNRAVIQVLNLSLTYAFVIFAVVSLAHTEDMLMTGLGRTLLLLIGILWLLRAVEQPIFFGFKKPLSVGFFVFFLIGAGLYLAPAFSI